MSDFEKDQVQDIYPLSPMQEGMLFHSLLHPGQSFYVEQISMQITGSLRSDLLAKSLNVLLDRYEIFRTVFVHERVKRPVQVVLKRRDLQVREIDVSGFPTEDQAQRIQDYKRQDREKGFDLSKDILMRATVFKKGEGLYDWVWSYHHILLDGWCFGIVVHELFQVYDAFRQNKPYTLLPAKPYKEYIKWLEQQDKAQSLQYWCQYLSGFDGQTTFAEQRKKPPREGYDSEETSFTLAEEQTQMISGLVSRHGVTLSTVLQAAWAVLLSRYQRTNDVIFGTVVSGRPPEISSVENIVGLFINVIPKRVRLSQDMSFAELISSTQNESFASETHQYIPLYDIQSQTQNHDLIDHIIVFENYPQQATNQHHHEQNLGFAIEETRVVERSSYDLNLLASPGSELLLKLAYNTNVYDRAFIHRVSEQLKEILRQISQNPLIPLGAIQVVTEEERHQLLAEFNPLPSAEADSLTLPQRFEQHAEHSPDRIALIAGNQTLSYAQLNGQANRLARLLHSRGVNRGTIVPMLIDRSPEMIIGILAILKAGGAYLPIDPTYPEHRIRYMLKDSCAALLLTRRALAEQINTRSYHESHLFVDDPALSDEDGENLAFSGNPDDLAYVMYTSGTTGNPKGNLTTHANIARVVKNTNYIDITADDILLSLSNYAFDGFTFDLFGALLNGARLVVAPNETITHISKLTQLIEGQHITVMFVTTALFNLLVDAGAEWMEGLRKLLFGGERSSVNHVRKALRRMGPGRLVHVYGPTETTVFATFFPVDEISDGATAIPIGRPLTNTAAYILGTSAQLQPIEAVGELCLSGTGLSCGYLNQPDLTAEKFVPHPFQTGERLYRTGDLARWLGDGNIEFVGRIDDQVKIRGHRIEIGEIEAQLLRYPGVKEAIVLANQSDSGETSLIAYVVSQPDNVLSNEQLHGHLTRTLPSYMVPPSYMLLDHLPLTPNGKVNRSLLPTVTERLDGCGDDTQPRNDVETRLVSLWSEALRVPNIGIHDDFFALGGHSLKAMSLCAQILKEFQVDVPIRLFFETPTVAGISAFLQSDGGFVDGISMEPEDDGMTIMNPDGVRNLYVFPPVLGYGIVFRELAKQLPEYRIHAFDFMEQEDRIGRYSSRIQSIQSSGSVAILGYSAGCGLAFEVAKALENAGQSVDVLIVVDSYKKNGKSDLQGRTVQEDVEALMEVNQDNVAVLTESIREGLARKMSAYYRYFVELINTGQVRANVHLIQSESVIALPQELTSWNEATTGVYREHQGHGQHEQMLQGSFAELNAKIIADILRDR